MVIGKPFLLPACLGWLLLWLAIPASAQTSDHSPEGLIRFLTDPSDRSLSENLGLTGCGVDEHGRADREAARLLISQGDAASSKLEFFLSSLEANDPAIIANVHWLLFAYAKIRGPAAFPLLSVLHDSRKLRTIHGELDHSIALSLQLTSYISGAQEPGLQIRCREQQPRDALDQLIRSWQRGNPEWLEASLGPKARATLTAALKDRTWVDLHTASWTRSSRLTAVGYRFEIRNSWSEPEWRLEDYRETRSKLPELNTKFTTRSGANCGEHTLNFIQVPKGEPPAFLTYLVDNSDIMEVLHIVSACAAVPAEAYAN